MAGPSNGIVNGLKNENGKRERTDQEDDQEFMPLSKRINNIHLSPERLMNGNRHFITSHAHVNGVVNVGYPISSGSNQNHQVPHPHYGDPPGHFSDYSNEASQFQQRLGQGALRQAPSQYGNSNGVLPVSSGLIAASSSSQVQHSHLMHSNTPHNMQVPGLTPGHNDSRDKSSSIEYRPSLNESANPHYYESNRALFHLYLERQLRTNQSPHPEVFTRTLNALDSSNNTM